MLELLDRLAAWWLNWRTDQAVKRNPDFQAMGFQKANVTPEGMDMLIHAPALMVFCEEAAALLNAHSAENHTTISLIVRGVIWKEGAAQ